MVGSSVTILHDESEDLHTEHNILLNNKQGGALERSR